jgi:hypothetical protein
MERFDRESRSVAADRAVAGAVPDLGVDLRPYPFVSRSPKRSDQIARHMAESGYQCDRAERIAARATRPPKRRAG